MMGPDEGGTDSEHVGGRVRQSVSSEPVWWSTKQTPGNQSSYLGKPYLQKQNNTNNNKKNIVTAKNDA